MIRGAVLTAVAAVVVPVASAGTPAPGSRVPPPVPTQEGQESPFVGQWSGTLNANLPLRIVFHIEQGSDGRLRATFDSPDQGAFGIAFDSATAAGDTLQLVVRAIGGRFAGVLCADGGCLEGMWWQSGTELPLRLERTSPEANMPRRPQEPEPPLPYRVEEVSYPNPDAGITLAGTLTLPEGPGPYPAVVLLSGSGPQDRDETVFGHRPFLVLADDLTRRGIAVLRFDDRGVGESGGSLASATTEDFVSDALAGVRYLVSRPEIDRKRIGLVGHSEGGLVAPLAAVRSSDVAFLVLIAAPALNGGRILELQVEAINRASGVPEPVIAERVAAQRRIMRIVGEVSDDSAAARQLRAALREIGMPQAQIDTQVRALLSPWMRHFVTYDPLPTLRKVAVPVLVVAGEKDVQVPPDVNLPLIEQALREGACPDYTVRKLAGLNHLLQPAETGLPAEYARIEQTIAPEALEMIGAWIVERTRSATPSGAP